MLMKWCPRCHKTKPPQQFWPTHATCKDCTNVRRRVLEASQKRRAEVAREANKNLPGLNYCSNTDDINRLTPSLVKVFEQIDRMRNDAKA